METSRHLPVAGPIIRNVVSSRRRARPTVGPSRQIGVIIVARRRRRPGIIWVLVRTTRGRVVFNPRTRGSTASISIAFIVVSADGDGRPLTVVIPGTVSTGRREPSVVFIHGRVGPARGARPIWVTDRTLFEGLDLGLIRWGSICEFLVGWLPYIRNACHARAFEFTLVQLFHGGLQIVGGFKFNKPFSPCQWGDEQMLVEHAQRAKVTHPLPCSRPVSE